MFREQSNGYFVRTEKSHKSSKDGNLQFSHYSATAAPVNVRTPADAWCQVFQRYSDT